MGFTPTMTGEAIQSRTLGDRSGNAHAHAEPRVRVRSTGSLGYGVLHRVEIASLAGQLHYARWLEVAWAASQASASLYARWVESRIVCEAGTTVTASRRSTR